MSTTSFSPKSHNQEASVFAMANYDTVWEVETDDPKIRFESRGKPVPANTGIVLKHSSTNQHLAACKLPIK